MPYKCRWEGGGVTLMKKKNNPIKHTFMIACPNVDLSMAYLVASSRHRCAKPTAPAATGGLVRSNAPIAILKPAPSAASTF